MLSPLMSWLEGAGFESSQAQPVAVATAFTVVLFGAALCYIVARQLTVRLIPRRLGLKTANQKNLIVQNRVHSRLAHIAPALIINRLGPSVLAPYPGLVEAIDVLSMVYVVIAIASFVHALIDSFLVDYSTYEHAREFPLTSLMQVAKLLVFGIGFILVYSLLFDQSPFSMLTSLGAVLAGATFVFKDSILGFVAGLQLTANELVAVGDWIEMPKYGVDGDVMDITMTTVKVRNFDQTITTVPTYALISDSFKNWRGIKEVGGRRVKRHVLIDIGSIRFCDEALLARMGRMSLMRDYLARKASELEECNRNLVSSGAPTTDGRRLTNVGSFRAYLLAYLRSHPKVNQELRLIVRQLPPTSEGLPIELYFFADTTDWPTYEEIQADVFDHILAAAGEFDVHIFQRPSGADLQQALSPSHSNAPAPSGS